MSLETQLKQYRNKLKVDTNKELADKLNINYQTLATWIRRGEIPKKVLFRIEKQIQPNIENRKLNLYNPEVRFLGDEITNLLPSVMSTIFLKKIDEEICCYIICEYIDSVISELNIPYSNDSSVNNLEENYTYLDWIPNLIMDFVLFIQKEEVNNLMPQETFASLFSKNSFRTSFRAKIGFLEDDIEDIDEFVIDQVYKIRTILKTMPIRVINFWLSGNDIQNKKIAETWKSYTLARIKEYNDDIIKLSNEHYEQTEEAMKAEEQMNNDEHCIGESTSYGQVLIDPLKED